MCGNGSSDAPYIDPAIFYEWEGQVYFCTSCAVEIGETAGCTGPEVAELLHNQAEALLELNEELTEKLNAAESRLGNYDALFADAISIAKPSDSNVQAAEEPAESSSESAYGGEVTMPKSAKSVKGRRSVHTVSTSAGDTTPIL